MERQSTSTLQERKDQEVLKLLTHLLRSHGEQILTGQSKLSLTTRSLCILNESFSLLLGEDELVTSFDVIPQTSPKLHLAQDIQFLYDFMQKTIALKIIHISSTLQGRVNLSPFRTLRVLEIKKTPLHLLEGIQRMRGKLNTIICSRSLSSLQELFETCGGDLSTPMSWPELKSACLAFNSIEKLDASLRLVPGLVTLDLSHNSIKDTNRCLEYLTEVSAVNLGYNRLVHVPTFAITTRAKLTALVLRNNNLENINGISELTGLRDVDLSDNCLCDHDLLSPLKALHRLATLLLQGNPVSYHDDHRLLTIEKLNQTTAPRVTLDSQLISQAEIQAAEKLTMAAPSKLLNGENMTSVSRGSFEHSVESANLSDPERTRTRRQRHSGRSSRRVRQAAISDMDSGCDAESDFPPVPSDTSLSSTPAMTEHLDMKTHMETVRNQLGPDWLQTLVHSRRQMVEASAGHPQNGPPRQVQNGGQHVHCLQAELHPEPHIDRFDCIDSDDGCQQSSQSSALVPVPCTNGQHVPTQRFEGSVPENERPRLAKFAIGSLNDSAEGDDSTLAENYVDSVKSRPAAPISYNYPSSLKSTSGRTNIQNSDTLSDHIEVIEHSVDKEHVASVTESESSTLVKSAEFDNIYDSKQRHMSSSQSEEVDYGVESEPFIVSHMTDTDTQHLVSVTQRYLLEKDINGDVIEALDLRCLIQVETLAFAAMADDRPDASLSDSQEGQVLKLTFDHVRKDKRERLYFIDEDATCQGLQELLQPIVDTNQAQANLRDQMQCLKCSRELSKQQCSRDIRQHGSVTVNSDIYSTSAERGDLREVLLCPYCGSDMLIKFDGRPRPYPELTAVHTPVGSFKEPNATSSTNPSPWKRNTESPINVPDTSQMTVGSFKSTHEASSFHSAADTSTFTSPRDSAFLTPSSSQVDFTSANTENANATQQPETSLKTVYMSQSVIEMPSNSETDTADVSMGTSSVTTPIENQVFHRNLSGQDLSGRYRRRQDSGSSDILVLSRHPSMATYASQESDISLLSNPSQSSIAILDSSSTTLNEIDTDNLLYRQNANLEIVREMGDFPEPLRESDLSPAGSLTNKTLSSMINSVYEKSIYDASHISGVNNDSESCTSCDDIVDGVSVVSASNSNYRSNSSTPHAQSLNTQTLQAQTPNSFTNNARPSVLDTAANNGNPFERENLTPTPTNGAEVFIKRPAEEPWKMRFCYTDFSQMDHRLKLYLMMSVCKDEDEELLLINRCSLWHYSKAEEVPGLVIVSTSRIYFFKVTGPERVENPDKWLKLIQFNPVVDLCYVDIGLGHQTVRLEFSSDSACFTLIMRDADRCKVFTSQLTGHIQSVTFHAGCKLEGITKNNPVTMKNLRHQVLEPDILEEGDEEDATIITFNMAYHHTGEINTAGEKKTRPVSIVVTPMWVHLVDENLNWPAPRGAPQPKGDQFIPKDRQRITDITQLDLYQSAALEVNIVFYDEQSSEECTWRLSMETSGSLSTLVQKVKQLWDEQFGVDLLINYNDDQQDSS